MSQASRGPCRCEVAVAEEHADERSAGGGQTAQVPGLSGGSGIPGGRGGREGSDTSTRGLAQTCACRLPSLVRARGSLSGSATRRPRAASLEAQT